MKDVLVTSNPKCLGRSNQKLLGETTSRCYGDNHSEMFGGNSGQDEMGKSNQRCSVEFQSNMFSEDPDRGVLWNKSPGCIAHGVSSKSRGEI